MTIRRKSASQHPYTLLNERLLQKVQELAGQRWTDFNAHDPGVTILDVWTYGLFDLQYRLELDFGSFFPHDERGRLDFATLGLHDSEVLFEASTVTAADQERLLTTRVAGVADCRLTVEDGGVVVEVVVARAHPPTQVVAQVRGFFRQHRLLGQLLRDVRVVTSLEKVSDAEGGDPMDGFTGDAPSEVPPVRLPEQPFRSMQYDMPQLYGLGAEGIPMGLDSQHEAHIFQLKAYMLLADYLLSSAEQQLRSIPELIGKKSYSPPAFKADVTIPGIDRLLDEDKCRKTAVFDDHSTNIQRLAFAKWRCAMYGETVEEILILLQHGHPADQLANVLVDITDRLPMWQRSRFLGLDLDGKAVLPLKAYFSALLGLETDIEQPLSVRMDGLAVRLLDDEAFAKRHNVEPMMVVPPKGSRVFRIKPIRLPEERWTEKECARYVGLIKQGVLFEAYLQAGIELENYRMIEHSGSYTLCLVLESRKQWIGIMKSPSGSRLVELANALQRYLRLFRRRHYACYVIEHALLLNSRGALPEDHQTISVVLPAIWQHIQGQAWMEDWWRQRLPAHLLIKITWLSVHQMEKWEREYFRWREGWHKSQPTTVVQASTELRRRL